MTNYTTGFPRGAPNESKFDSLEAKISSISQNRLEEHERKIPFPGGKGFRRVTHDMGSGYLSFD
jgi:hypothetical protein